jgi:hypothetical protein
MTDVYHHAQLFLLIEMGSLELFPQASLQL